MTGLQQYGFESLQKLNHVRSYDFINDKGRFFMPKAVIKLNFVIMVNLYSVLSWFGVLEKKYYITRFNKNQSCHCL